MFIMSLIGTFDLWVSLFSKEFVDYLLSTMTRAAPPAVVSNTTPRSLEGKLALITGASRG
jgi:hypothetical protein